MNTKRKDKDMSNAIKAQEMSDCLYVDCEICGLKTQMTATKRCDRCWELETRIKRDFDLAKKIFERIRGGENG